MPPFHSEENALTTDTCIGRDPHQLDGPRNGRRASHRGSAIVPREVLLASQLGLLEPAPEEPIGVCIYARDSILTKGEEMMIEATSNAFRVPSTASGSSARLETLPVTRRSGKRRGVRNSVQTMESTANVGAWMSCTDNSCTIS